MAACKILAKVGLLLRYGDDMPDAAGRRNKGDQPVVIFPSEWPHSAPCRCSNKKRDECTSRFKNMELLEQYYSDSRSKNELIRGSQSSDTSRGRGLPWKKIIRQSFGNAPFPLE